MGYMNNDAFAHFWANLKLIHATFVKSVNGTTPDQNGNVAITVPVAATANPLMDGTVAVGTATKYAREDHRHPVDTGRAPASLTADVTIANGDKLVITDASDSNKIARASISFDGSTTSQVLSKKGTWVSLPTVPSAATEAPLIDGTAAVGTSSKYAREDHVHPTDTTRAPLDSPTFTGTVTAPNPNSNAIGGVVVTAAWVREFYAHSSIGSASFKGVINSFTEITNNLHYIEKGWYWVIGTAGTYAGQDCEQGDFLYAIDTYIYGSKTISGASYQYGDVNMDGYFTASDSALISRYLEGLSTLTSDQLLLADVNGDGTVTQLDADLILDAISDLNIHHNQSGVPNSAFAVVQTNITPMTNAEIDTIMAS